MCLILAIDSSSTQLDISLYQEGSPACSYSRYLPGSHAEHISDAVSFILDSAGVLSSDITHAAIVVGPGSFTGLRIGIAFVKGFFLMRDIPILPVSSLLAIARGWPANNDYLSVVLEARRKNVFSARFYKRGDWLQRISEDSCMSIERFRSETPKSDIILIDTLGYTKSRIYDDLEDFSNIYSIEKQLSYRALASARIAYTKIKQKSCWLSPPQLLPRYMQQSAAEKRM